jgi:hypothetical protein
LEEGVKDPDRAWIIVAPVFVGYLHGSVPRAE